MNSTYRLIIVLIFIMGCTDSKSKFDLQGHRGCRGLLPENSLPAFLKAIDLGVNTLEMDVVISRDRHVVVSHEPYMSAEFCRTPDGDDINETDQFSYNLFQMDYADIRKFECGTRIHHRFPDQQKIVVFKPLLSQVFDTVEAHQTGVCQVNYNIEIKSEPRWDLEYHPEPAEFSQLVYGVIDGQIDWSRITIQSFDFRILQYFHEHYPEVKLAVLIENQESEAQNLQKLGFIPEIYSCDFTLLSRQSVDYLHQKGMKVIPWTVNEINDMSRLISWEVDGLITDYPNRFNSIDQ